MQIDELREALDPYTLAGIAVISVFFSGIIGSLIQWSVYFLAVTLYVAPNLIKHQIESVPGPPLDELLRARVQRELEFVIGAISISFGILFNSYFPTFSGLFRSSPTPKSDPILESLLLILLSGAIFSWHIFYRIGFNVRSPKEKVAIAGLATPISSLDFDQYVNDVQKRGYVGQFNRTLGLVGPGYILAFICLLIGGIITLDTMVFPLTELTIVAGFYFTSNGDNAESTSSVGSLREDAFESTVFGYIPYYFRSGMGVVIFFIIVVILAFSVLLTVIISFGNLMMVQGSMNDNIIEVLNYIPDHYSYYIGIWLLLGIFITLLYIGPYFIWVWLIELNRGIHYVSRSSSTQSQEINQYKIPEPAARPAGQVFPGICILASVVLIPLLDLFPTTVRIFYILAFSGIWPILALIVAYIVYRTKTSKYSHATKSEGFIIALGGISEIVGFMFAGWAFEIWSIDWAANVSIIMILLLGFAYLNHNREIFDEDGNTKLDFAIPALITGYLIATLMYYSLGFDSAFRVVLALIALKLAFIVERVI